MEQPALRTTEGDFGKWEGGEEEGSRVAMACERPGNQGDQEKEDFKRC